MAQSNNDKQFQEDYERGKADGAAGTYKEPVGLLADTFGAANPLKSTDEVQRDSDRNSAYTRGYDEGRQSPKR